MAKADTTFKVELSRDMATMLKAVKRKFDDFEHWRRVVRDNQRDFDNRFHDYERAIRRHDSRIDNIERAYLRRRNETPQPSAPQVKDHATRLDQLESANDAHQIWLADLHDTVQSISDLANRVGAIEAEREAKGRREGVWTEWRCPNGLLYPFDADRCDLCGAVRPRLAGES